jgi:hypothetical protein
MMYLIQKLLIGQTNVQAEKLMTVFMGTILFAQNAEVTQIAALNAVPI